MRTKNVFITILCLILIFYMVGCAGETTVNPDVSENDFAKLCQEICAQSIKGNSTETELDVTRKLISCFDEYGYSAVDRMNQIDMVQSQAVIDFCEHVSLKEKAETSLITVNYSEMMEQEEIICEIIKYDFETQDGNVDVTRCFYVYDGKNTELIEEAEYLAEEWKYTQEGYLMFSGEWFSDESYMLTLSDTKENAAFRVLPLEEKNREWNRQYLLPVGFEENNLFTIQWDEEDYGTLNFYDLYDIFYPMVMGEDVPYKASEDLGEGLIYQIPKEEFETVIMEYIDIDSETLQAKTKYSPETETYEYRPRGFHEVEFPDYPYTEVIDSVENEDGTVTLIAQVVYPYWGSSKLYVHEVTVRPLENGRKQYVSNRILTSEDEYEIPWHVPRLTDEGWKEVYE